MTSPLENRPARASTAASVTWPAGSINHAALGGLSLPARSSRDVAVSAPLAAACFNASGCRSYATTSCRPLSRRSVMLAPILPRPIMPILMRPPLGCPAGSEGSGFVGQRLQQLLEGLGEPVHALVLERLLHVLHVDPGLAQAVQGGRGARGVGVDGPLQRAVVLER